MKFLTKLRRDDAGATAIEYGLIAGLISVVIIGTITAVGGSLDDVFTSIQNSLDSVPDVAAPPAG